VAAAIWPDLEDRAAGRNLRVTLTHLLDVLDPDRERSQGSRVVADRAGSLSFTRGGGLHIDLWTWKTRRRPSSPRQSLTGPFCWHSAVNSPDPERGRCSGESRRRVARPHRRRLNDLVIAAALTAGDRALAAGDPRLAEALAHRALATDPWSERAQRVVVEPV